MHRSVLSGTTTAVVRGESNSASANRANEDRPCEDPAGDRADSNKAVVGTALTRLTASPLAALLLVLAGLSGFAGPIGPYRPPVATIGNPDPYFMAGFGYSLAGVGNDRILVGVPQDNAAQGVGGRAYLFRTNGTVLATFTNPLPQILGRFGCAVAAFGHDRVLVGARQNNVGATNAGAAYLFSAGGTLLTTFTNPPATPNDHFGYSVAAVGTNLVLVGAPQDGTGGESVGSAYLFDTNGVLMTTFHNPTPDRLDGFGSAVAGLGDGLALIGVFGDDAGGRDSGVVHLFTTAGGLVTTITNPAPVAGGSFGANVAALGTDRILVSAEGNYAGGLRAGAAYLFATNGTVLATFTNPAPANGDQFGHSVAAVGGARVLIGAFLDDTGAGKAGAAYLFETNGALLATFVNPTPEPSDRFAYAVANLGTDLFLVGSDSDNTGATGAGSVYVYAVPGPPPPLGVAVDGSAVAVRWVAPEPGFILQQAGVLGSPSAWSDVAETPQVNGPTNLVTQPLTTTNRFYRLRWQ